MRRRVGLWTGLSRLVLSFNGPPLGGCAEPAEKQADEREVSLWSSGKGWEAHAGGGWKIKKAGSTAVRGLMWNISGQTLTVVLGPWSKAFHLFCQDAFNNSLVAAEGRTENLEFFKSFISRYSGNCSVSASASSVLAKHLYRKGVPRIECGYTGASKMNIDAKGYNAHSDIKESDGYTGASKTDYAKIY